MQASGSGSCQISFLEVGLRREVGPGARLSALSESMYEHDMFLRRTGGDPGQGSSWEQSMQIGAHAGARMQLEAGVRLGIR